MRLSKFPILTFILLFAVSSVCFGYDKFVTQSERQIPVMDTVDVVVVGGTSAGVAAAVETAGAGAKVFVAAPKSYLGEDICSFYRYGMTKDVDIDDPLAVKLFAEPDFVPRKFTYKSSIPCSKFHSDTSPPSLLNDGMWATAASHSVQYEDSVSFTIDLGEAVAVPAVHAFVYHRPRDFVVDKISVSVSNNAKDWTPVATVSNDTTEDSIIPDRAVDLKAVIGKTARYIKLDVHKQPGTKRILIGEIAVETSLSEEGVPTKDRIPPRPMQVKDTLDQALLSADIPFLYRCYVTDILRDAEGNFNGVVVVNRSGRQAIRAKVLIDATVHATACRAAGLDMSTFVPDLYEFSRVVIGSGVHPDFKEQSRKAFFPVSARDGVMNGLFYSFEINMREDSFAELSRIENVVRDRTWERAQLDSAENVFFIPKRQVRCRETHVGLWPGAESIGLDVFRPKDMDGVFVLNAYAGISGSAKKAFLDPLEYIKVGRRIGKAAAEASRGRRISDKARVTGFVHRAEASGEVKELLIGPRPFSKGLATVLSAEQSLPVIAEYDVVVIGGGTGGAPAGISAARHGAKTLIVEYVNGLGGVSTVGLIGRYHFGHDIGFCRELDEGVREMGGPYAQNGREWSSQVKQEWFRQQAVKAGADIWFDSMGCGAFVENGTVKGVVVATPYGRGVVLCDAVIDSTGNADIAIAAGAAYRFSNESDAAMQGTGYPPFNPGAMYTNTDYLIVDDADVVDVHRATLIAKKKFGVEYDLSPMIDTRERRRIVGDYELTPLDIVTGRTFSDTINWARSNFDTHGFSVTPAYYVVHPDPESNGVDARVPYRCLLPKGLEGILVTGLGVSAHRDAIPIIRMQPDVHNQGYAAGLAAATAVRGGKPLRKIDVRKLQKQLVEKGNLPEKILRETDEFEISRADLQRAIDRILDNPIGIATLFAAPDASIPLVRRAYVQTDSREKKILYARILGVLGDDTGIDTLIKEIESYKQWDSGFKWRSQGHEAFGRSISTLDGLIIAAGMSKNKKALAPILDKVRLLGDKDDFTHHRAVALALESLADSGAAEALRDLLRKPGISGYAVTDIQKAISDENIIHMAAIVENTFREIILARALYRCGDSDQTAERILRQYQNDLRGHFARHAHLILED